MLPAAQGPRSPSGVELDWADERGQRLGEVGKRLALVRQAGFRVNESLNFDTVLRGVPSYARSLTGARLGGIWAKKPTNSVT